MDEQMIPGVILAGGQGRRIGGQKAEVLLGGKPLWRHVADRVEPQVSVLAVNAAVPMEGYPLIKDSVPNLGPLGGILAAMVWAKERGAIRVLTVAVDTPFLPLDLVGRLRAAEGQIVMAETADGAHGTTALWSVALADDLEAVLADGMRKVTDWSSRHQVAKVRFEDTAPSAFFNINTMEDLVKAETWL